MDPTRASGDPTPTPPQGGARNGGEQRAERSRGSPARALLIGSALALALAAGCSKGPCEQTCARVAACKLEARQGSRMMGERAMPPDPACLQRCQEAGDHFAACEGKKRECSALLQCIPE